MLNVRLKGCKSAQACALQLWSVGLINSLKAEEEQSRPTKSVQNHHHTTALLVLTNCAPYSLVYTMTDTISRPKKDERVPLKMCSFKLPLQTIDQLSEIAKVRQHAKARVLREAIDAAHRIFCK